MPKTGIIASAIASIASPSVAFQESRVDPVGGTTVTFTGVNIGTASASRRVVVAVGSRSGTPTGCTIAGVTATLDGSDASPNQSYIYSAVVTTGTTGDIVVSFPGGSPRCGIGVWALENASPTGQTGTAANNADMNVTTSVGDVVIASAYEHGTNGSTATWTGATERYDETVETDMTHSGADVIATGTTTTVRVAFSATTGAACIAVAYG